MPLYCVEALKKSVVRTFFEVEAETPEQAEHLCKSGEVSYDYKVVEEGDEHWSETVSVIEC